MTILTLVISSIIKLRLYKKIIIYNFVILIFFVVSKLPNIRNFSYFGTEYFVLVIGSTNFVLVYKLVVFISYAQEAALESDTIIRSRNLQIKIQNPISNLIKNVFYLAITIRTVNLFFRISVYLKWFTLNSIILSNQKNKVKMIFP